MISTVEHLDLWFRVADWWFVNAVIGEYQGYMRARAGTWFQTTPPRKGWQYGTGMDFIHDPDMECAKPSLQCKSVSVELSGIRLKVQSLRFHRGFV